MTTSESSSVVELSDHTIVSRGPSNRQFDHLSSEQDDHQLWMARGIATRRCKLETSNLSCKRAEQDVQAQTAGDEQGKPKISRDSRCDSRARSACKWWRRVWGNCKIGHFARRGISRFDFGAELIVGSDGEEWDVGGHALLRCDVRGGCLLGLFGWRVRKVWLKLDRGE